MAFDKAKAVRAAEKYLAQNKIASAVQEYQRIVERDPDDINSLNTLGDLYARLDKKQDAVRCFQRVAEYYRQQGFVPKAVAVYKKITRLAPASPEVSVALAALYEQQGLIVDARTQYMLVADAYARSGQTKESLQVLRRAADLDPNNVQIRLRLAENCLAENLNEQAADAFIEAAERLLARGDNEAALDAYTKALAWRPHSYAGLRGMLAAHAALGTADEAAETLRRAVEERPGDLELRAMLARACVESEDAAGAESAVRELVKRDPTSYALFFDVARLQLRQGEVDEAVQSVARVIEPALSGRHEDALLEVLQEALARNPDQIDALRMLVRLYTWQRDDDHLRVALENLAEVAETLGLADDERDALTQLVRLAPYEWRYHERLQALGGTVPGAEPPPQQPEPEGEAAPASGEVPTFESFMMGEESFAPPAQPDAASPQASAPQDSEFEWNSVAAAEPPPRQDPSASFADLNEDFAERPGATSGGEQAAQPSGFDFPAEAPSGQGRPAVASGEGSHVASMLAQELESVDFYLAQGYTEIASDTLDMLERQYGAHPDIDARRRRLSEAPAGESHEINAPSEGYAATPQEFATRAESPNAGGDAAVGSAFAESAPPVAPPAPVSAAPAAQARDKTAGIDPGLAAIFDEFREAVEEDDDAAQDGDFETHYNMGLAYQEMELLDQAVEEFQKAVAMVAAGDGTTRYLQCCNMLGHCFMRQGVPRAAALWFRRGLDAPGHTEDEYQALRYELGTAYEQMGDLGGALNVFTEVYGIDVSYRGVADKLRELQARKAVTSDQ